MEEQKKFGENYSCTDPVCGSSKVKYWPENTWWWFFAWDLEKILEHGISVEVWAKKDGSLKK
jgi:hypothetical protein